MPISNCNHPPCHIPSAGDLVCHCNQLSTPGCNAVNGSWGNCTLTRGEGVCLASYEVLLGTNEVNIQHTCSTDEILKRRCLREGVTKSGSAQYPIITACCEKDYCNTPQYLQQFYRSFIVNWLIEHACMHRIGIVFNRIRVCRDLFCAKVPCLLRRIMYLFTA